MPETVFDVQGWILLFLQVISVQILLAAIDFFQRRRIEITFSDIAHESMELDESFQRWIEDNSSQISRSELQLELEDERESISVGESML